MTPDEVIAHWKSQGSPQLDLGSGETCVDLEKMLKHDEIKPRQVQVVRDWVNKEREEGRINDGN